MSVENIIKTIFDADNSKFKKVVKDNIKATRNFRTEAQKNAAAKGKEFRKGIKDNEGFQKRLVANENAKLKLSKTGTKVKQISVDKQLKIENSLKGIRNDEIANTVNMRKERVRMAKVDKKMAKEFLNNEKLKSKEIKSTGGILKFHNGQAKIQYEGAASAAEGLNRKIRTGNAMNALSFLFLGQQVAATMKRIASASLNAFATIGGSTNSAAVQFRGLGVAMDIIKFGLGSAIATVFKPFIPILMSIGEWFLNLTDTGKKWVGGIFVAITAMGFLVTLWAQFVLVSASYKTLKMASILAKGGDAALLASKKVGLLGKAWLFTKKSSGKFATSLGKIPGLYKTIFAKSSLLSKITIFGVWAIAIAVVIWAFKKMKDHLGSTGNALKAFGIFGLAVFAALGDIILLAFIGPLNLVVWTLNLLLKGFQKLGKFEGVEPIVLPDALKVGALSKKVWEMRNNLLNNAEIERLNKINAENNKPTSISGVLSEGLDAEDQKLINDLDNETFTESGGTTVTVNNEINFNETVAGDEAIRNIATDVIAETNAITDSAAKLYGTTYT